jgi:hypothetical protein
VNSVTTSRQREQTLNDGALNSIMGQTPRNRATTQLSLTTTGSEKGGEVAAYAEVGALFFFDISPVEDAL